MAFTGILYLVFEETIAAKSKSGPTAAASATSGGSRRLMGIQVCVVLVY